VIQTRFEASRCVKSLIQFTLSRTCRLAISALLIAGPRLLRRDGQAARLNSKRFRRPAAMRIGELRYAEKVLSV
jgi:hypothetical protein